MTPSWRIQGIKNVQRGIKALRTSFHPLGRIWADETVTLARQKVEPFRRSGRTQRSIRRKSSGRYHASVTAKYGAKYLEHGAPPHTITPSKAKRLRWKDGGTVRFAKKVDHPGAKRKKFLRPAARESLEKLPMLKTIIDQWNRAIK